MTKEVILILLVSIVTTACRLTDTEQVGPANIVVTTGIIKDGVEYIVGDQAEVVALMGPGTDPHLYKPTPSDVAMLHDADIIIVNGLHLEGKMAEMLGKFGREKSVIVLADGISEKDKIKTADFGDSYDPHIWFDPIIWRDGLEHVKEELIKLDSTKRKKYHDNFTQYVELILETDNWMKDHLANIHDSSRVLITSHDAFSYFGRRYGIEVKGIQGVSTLSEVGLRDISNMVDFVIAKQIKSIFVETSTSDKTAQAIVAGTKQKGYSLAIDGPLYSDALGELGTPAGTYLGMLKENVRMIVKGLK